MEFLCSDAVHSVCSASGKEVLLLPQLVHADLPESMWKYNLPYALVMDFVEVYL